MAKRHAIRYFFFNAPLYEDSCGVTYISKWKDPRLVLHNILQNLPVIPEDISSILRGCGNEDKVKKMIMTHANLTSGELQS